MSYKVWKINGYQIKNKVRSSGYVCGVSYISLTDTQAL
jgi:hypothetical protein